MDQRGRVDPVKERIWGKSIWCWGGRQLNVRGFCRQEGLSDPGSIRGAAAQHVVFPGARPCWGRYHDVDRKLILVVPVYAPLPDIAVHVAEAPWIGALAADRVCLLAAVGRRPRIIPQVTITVAAREARLRAGTTGVHPLRLGRQSAHLPRLPPPWPDEAARSRGLTAAATRTKSG